MTRYETIEGATCGICGVELETFEGGIEHSIRPACPDCFEEMMERAAYHQSTYKVEVKE